MLRIGQPRCLLWTIANLEFSLTDNGCIIPHNKYISYNELDRFHALGNNHSLTYRASIVELYG